MKGWYVRTKAMIIREGNKENGRYMKRKKTKAICHAPIVAKRKKERIW